MDKGFEIADIIVAFIKGNATPEQIVRLDEWQNESDENKRLFVSLLDETTFLIEIQRQFPMIMYGITQDRG